MILRSRRQSDGKKNGEEQMGISLKALGLGRDLAKYSHFWQLRNDSLSKLSFVLLRIMSCDWLILIQEKNRIY